jgi:hypothetical protein
MDGRSMDGRWRDGRWRDDRENPTVARQRSNEEMQAWPMADQNHLNEKRRAWTMAGLENLNGPTRAWPTGGRRYSNEATKTSLHHSFPMSGTGAPRSPPVEQRASQILPAGLSDYLCCAYLCCAPAGHPSLGLPPQRAGFPPDVAGRRHSSDPWPLPACPFRHPSRRRWRTHCAPKGRDEEVGGNQQAFWGV